MTDSQLTRLLNWSAIAIALSLIVVVSYQLYLRHYVQSTSSYNYQFDDLPGTASAPVTANIDDIISKHVFGVIPKVATTRTPVVVKAAPKPTPKSRLDIKLTGIIDGSTPESGIAMMEVDRGKTIVVTVGEKIGKTDAILHQVMPSEILIDRDGVIESVKMVRKTLSIANLESALYDSLPQPFVETNNGESDQHQNPRSTAASTPNILKPGQGKPSQAATKANQPPVIRRVEQKPMKSLPVPRALQ